MLNEGSLKATYNHIIIERNLEPKGSIVPRT